MQQQKLKKAFDISKVYNSLSRKDPLTVKELDEFYQNADAARGDRVHNQISRLLLNNTDIVNKHLLFVGYGGCGKSTELRRLEKKIQDEFLVFNFSIFEELDPNKIHYIELIIVTMETLFAYLDKNKMEIDQKYLNNISDFLKITEITEIKNTYMGAEASVGGEIKATIPFLSKFFAKFKGVVKTSRSIKKVLTDKVEPHFSVLLGHCNDLIAQIRLHLKTLGKKDLVIIIEDLDKIKFEEAKNLFLNYASQITLLKANVIYTFPIALHYATNFNTIKGYFTKAFELPMIKVHEKIGDEDKTEEGYKVMRAIIGARMDLTLFENQAILDDFIKWSGGCLRDLFDMIIEAAESAQDEEREKINDADKQYAFKKIKKDYRNTIADYTDEEGKFFSAKEYYEILNSLNNSTSKILGENTDALMHLRKNLTVLGYNGDGWCDVHPVMRVILKERENA